MTQRIANILYLFMIAILASCTPESEVQELSDVYISFQTAVRTSAVSQTRSIIEGDQLPEDLSVGIYAKASDLITWVNPSLQNIRLDSDGQGGLTPGIIAKSLDAADYDFYAYSPYNVSPEIIGGIPCVPITIESNIANQQDILYAHEARASLSGKTATVDLNFSHVLSRLMFYAETPKTQFTSSYGPVFKKITITTTTTQADCVLNLNTGKVMEKTSATQKKELTKSFSKTLVSGPRHQLSQFVVVPTKVTQITVEYIDEDKHPGTRTFNLADLPDGKAIDLESGHVQPIILKYDNKKVTLRKPEIGGEVCEWEHDEEEDNYTIEIQ